MSKVKNDVRIIGFNKYDKPVIKEITGQKWVTNGKDNEYYNYLIERYKGSTTHASICDSYKNLIYGNGLAEKEVDQDSKEWKDFLKLFSKKDQQKVIADYQILGAFSFQIHRQRGNRKMLAKLEHIAKDLVVPSVEDENGKITSYWFSKNWKNKWKYPPKEYAAFGTSNDDIEIYVGQPYVVGEMYFPQPDFAPVLQYANVEEELSNYYLSHIKNGLSFGSVINVPNSYNWSDIEKSSYENKIKNGTTGSSNAGKIVINFMGGSDPITIENIENNTAHKQWDFLGNEARQQILTGHKCTSPSIVGVISSTGFSNTADEMDMAELQLMKRVISPKQNFLTEAVEEILSFFGIEKDLYFVPLTEVPEEATTQEKEQANTEEKVVEEKVSLSNDCGCQKKNFNLDEFLSKGEDEDLEAFDLIDEIEVDYQEEESLQFASTGVARPNAKSSQDGEDFIVRYKYVGNTAPEREFCQKMMSAKKIYRKEDILKLTDRPVNAGWGLNGADTYSIWLYKGGGSCHHKWNRVIYLKKGKNVDVNSPLATIISTSEARRQGKKIQTNNTLVSVAPINMPNQGFVNK